MVYKSSDVFLDSPFYNKYSSELVPVPNGNTSSAGATVIAKQAYRIVFMSSGNSSTAYYIDNKTIQDYQNLLQDCQNSNILVPAELLAQNITTFTI